MTQEQIKQVEKMRLQGMGYKAIATQLQISRERVRGYCKRHGYAGDANYLKPTLKSQVEDGKACKQCLKPFRHTQKRSTKKFCSDKCRREGWVKHNKHKHKTYPCHYCGQTFGVYGSKTQKYCSHECFVKHRFWRDEADGV